MSISRVYTLTDVTAITTTANSDGVHVQENATGYIFKSTATFNSGTSTLDIKVQHSPDNSVWKDLVNFTQVTTASAAEDVSVVAADTPVYPYLRVVRTVGGAGSPNYDLNVKAYIETLIT